LISANKADRGKGVECDGGTRRGTREHNNALKGRGKLRQRDNTELIAKETKKRVNPPSLVPRDGIFTEIIDFFRNYRFFGGNITVTMG
jgi:hypothetical protein